MTKPTQLSCSVGGCARAGPMALMPIAATTTAAAIAKIDDAIELDMIASCRDLQ